MKTRKYDWESNRNVAAVMPDFRRGKEHAFEVVFKELYRALFYFCDNMINDDQEAEDMCLMAFQALFQRCKEFDGERNIMAFLTVCVRNRCISHSKLKANRQKRELLACAEDIDTTLIDKQNTDDDLSRRVVAATVNIPEESMRVFKMLVYDEIEPKDVAKKLGITRSTVYSHKNIALRCIKSNLGLSCEKNRIKK